MTEPPRPVGYRLFYLIWPLWLCGVSLDECHRELHYNVRFNRQVAWKLPFRLRPDYVTLERHRAQDRTFGFAPIPAIQMGVTKSLKRTLKWCHIRIAMRRRSNDVLCVDQPCALRNSQP